MFKLLLVALPLIFGSIDHLSADENYPSEDVAVGSARGVQHRGTAGNAGYQHVDPRARTNVRHDLNEGLRNNRNWNNGGGAVSSPVVIPATTQTSPVVVPTTTTPTALPTTQGTTNRASGVNQK